LLLYSKLFYAAQRRGSERSAGVILPLVFSRANPKTVVDVGCGVGTWLAVAEQLGASTTAGVEGKWVVDNKLASPSIAMTYADLEEGLPALGRYDLAMCMEVAEHLTPGRGQSLVEDLCRLSDNVLFSAAIPWQGGVGHLNEQPQSYWAALFAENGYGACDVIRPAVWRDGRVDYWYRQNSVLYVKGAPVVAPSTLDRRHPAHFFSPGFVVEMFGRLRGRNLPPQAVPELSD
jgi:hypothetical protein